MLRINLFACYESGWQAETPRGVLHEVIDAPKQAYDIRGSARYHGRQITSHTETYEWITQDVDCWECWQPLRPWSWGSERRRPPPLIHPGPWSAVCRAVLVAGRRSTGAVVARSWRTGSLRQ